MTRRLLVSSLVVACVAAPLTAALAGTAAKPAKPQHISHGAKVNLADYLVPGKTVVFDFYSDYCPPCRAIAPMMEQLHAKRADVVVVKVDINRPDVKGIDFESPVAMQYRLAFVPYLRVYGPDGKLVAEDTDENPKARTLVLGWVEKL